MKSWTVHEMSVCVCVLVLLVLRGQYLTTLRVRTFFVSTFPMVCKKKTLLIASRAPND